ncbi:hypothetical protein CEUSTIGMA_g7589.t1 [Chlamydomonas eustigma]|uniref:Uncharacterized protein n=1 Tax=Chlamydomonas eustigma TaxID=1157962 RepID=A0A250XAN3_9CHLO|nr:hypothetical protein CEUSTIGMA_g7589.t1 [Chlamydomonas eustigma]|eukprot:GAX80151.1 hypothetical protein CEUSTIGMA_g7589.t1 [Chlamydomonas eustigma]
MLNLTCPLMTGQWGQAATSYRNLIRIVSTSQDVALRSRLPLFIRRQAESALKAGSYEEAEACYLQLLSSTDLGETDRLDLKCMLADSQLGKDKHDLELKIQSKLTQFSASGQTSSEAPVRLAAEAEWAEEGIELENDSVSSTLRAIIATAPPSPRYMVYYEAYLKRLRKYTYAAAPGSMERHCRRVAVLQFCRNMMQGLGGNQISGCCSSAAYEAALAMLEVEGDVTGHGTQCASCLPATMAVTGIQLSTSSSTLDQDQQAPSQQAEVSPFKPALSDIDAIARRMVHAFPWTSASAVHWVLAGRRRGLEEGQAAAAAAAANLGAPVVVTVLPARGQPKLEQQSGGPAPQLNAGNTVAVRRRLMIRELLAGLKRGVPSAAGWLAAAEMLLEQAEVQQRGLQQDTVSPQEYQATCKAALEAAKEGLRYIAHRDFLGKEHMEEAGLLLKLAAGRALLAHGSPAEAEALLVTLAERVSEGQATFGQIAGLPSLDVGQQAIRYLAQSALARGDADTARRLYEGLVGREACGRSSTVAESWAHAEYGWMMLKQGDVEVARQQLEAAVAAAEQELLRGSGINSSASNRVQTLALYRLHLGQVYWALGGECRTGRGTGAHAALLAAASIEGPHQGEAFGWLGRWYWELAADAGRAGKCFQRALALDPSQVIAGEGLVRLLTASGQTDTAMTLCTETLTSYPNLTWPWKLLSDLQLRSGRYIQEAVQSYQKAVRFEPASAALWEGLAAAYQGLGRDTAALKAFTRALELDHCRLYSLLQSAQLHYQLGSPPHITAACYQRALHLSPGHPVALLGGAEAWLAAAQVHAHAGAAGLAAVDLESAESMAIECANKYGNLTAAWKVLGDVLMQHVSVTPLPVLTRIRATDTSSRSSHAAAAAAAADEAMRARGAAVRRAKVAYCKALHLNPTQALCWGDVASAMYHDAQLDSSTHRHDQQGNAPSSAPAHNHHLQVDPVNEFSVPRRGSIALKMVQGGLRLEPSSDWLWALAGQVAGQVESSHHDKETGWGVREYCWIRALQLNPKRATTWAALSRMYALHEAGALAQQCLDHARSHEPTMVAVWEAMGYLSSAASKVPGDHGYESMMDSHAHAVGLGGGLESRIFFCAGSIKSGTGADGAVLSAAYQSALQLPTLPAAHNALGLALEARHPISGGGMQQAVLEYDTALTLLTQTQAYHTGCKQHYPDTHQGIGPTSTALVGPASHSQVPAASAIAVRVNLARALAKLGEEGGGAAYQGAASRAVSLFQQLAAEGAMQQDPAAWLAYAGALRRQGGVRSAAAVTEALEASLVAAAAAAGPTLYADASGEKALPAAHASRIGLTCALALCKHLIEQKQWEKAIRLVQDHAASKPGDACFGGLMMQMMLALVAGSAVQETGSTSGPAEVGRSAATVMLKEWAVKNQDVVDSSLAISHLHAINTASCTARGERTAALRSASNAVHTRPWDSQWRSLLSATAASVAPSYAVAASRSAPTGSREVKQSAPSLHHLAGTLPHTITDPASFAVAAADPTSVQKPDALQLIDLGYNHVLRCSGLLTALPLPQLQAQCLSEITRLSLLIHKHPDSAVAWYMMALTSLQLAIAAPGSQAKLYNQALVRCKGALSVVRAKHAAIMREKQQDGGNRIAVMKSGPPIAMMLGTTASTTKGQGSGSDSEIKHSTATMSLQTATMVLHLMLASTECLLHTQTAQQSQHEASQVLLGEAVSWADKNGLSMAPVHRLQARTYLSVKDLTAAEEAFLKAVQLGDVCSLVELSSLLSSTNRAREARQILNDHAGPNCGGALAQQSSLLQASGLLSAQLLMKLGELEAAKQLLVDQLLPAQQGNTAVSQFQTPETSWSAGLALQSVAALSLADLDADSHVTPASKRLVLEARWAASSCRRELLIKSSHKERDDASGSMALACLLLGQAELLRGKLDKGKEALEMAVKRWPRPLPISLEQFAD